MIFRGKQKTSKEETNCTEGDKESEKGDSKPKMQDDCSDNEESTDSGEDIENDKEFTLCL